MNKVVLIGVDGLTPDLLELWMNQGKLPYFQKIREKGASGKLESTKPPFSPPAWTSIITGCNPGKHGIYGFESTGTLDPHIINSRYRKAPAVWNYLSDVGMRSIVVNVPCTYPPEKINGIMITGLLTPSKESAFTYPITIKEKLNIYDLGEYPLEKYLLDDFTRSRMKKKYPQKLADIIIKQMETRSQVILNLMKEYDWDFTMIVFRGTDTAHHFFYDKKDLLLSCYQKVDELIGEIINKHPEATFFIVSDHGFEEINKLLYPDNVLYNAGFLTPTYNPYHSFKSLLFSLLLRYRDKFIGLLSSKFSKDSKLMNKLLFSNISKADLIDFSKTKAFSTADGRGIQICQKEKYELGIVENRDYYKTCEEIKTIFRELRDPDTGEKIIENIYLWNEIYKDDAKNPPDIIFDMKKGNTALEWIRFPNKIRDMIKSKERQIPYIFTNDPSGRTGDHSSYGIFFAYGKEIKTNYRVENMSVEDVLPLIFIVMNLPIPDNIDGAIFEDIFVDKLKKEKVNWEQYSLNFKKLSKVEKDRIEKLRNKLK